MMKVEKEEYDNLISKQMEILEDLRFNRNKYSSKEIRLKIKELMNSNDAMLSNFRNILKSNS